MDGNLSPVSKILVSLVQVRRGGGHVYHILVGERVFLRLFFFRGYQATIARNRTVTLLLVAFCWLPGEENRSITRLPSVICGHHIHFFTAPYRAETEEGQNKIKYAFLFLN